MEYKEQIEQACSILHVPGTKLMQVKHFFYVFSQYINRIKHIEKAHIQISGGLVHFSSYPNKGPSTAFWVAVFGV